MISHGLTILANEMQRHFVDEYGVSDTQDTVVLGNIAEGVVRGGGQNGVPGDSLVITLVNLREETAMKQHPRYERDVARNIYKVSNESYNLRLSLLLAATHTDYADALKVLSRGLRFLQSINVFTQDSVHAESITKNAPASELDRLVEFKMILDLYSPSMEEVNHLWGTLGGKQYAFAIYTLRLMELRFERTLAEVPVIGEGLISRRYVHREAEE